MASDNALLTKELMTKLLQSETVHDAVKYLIQGLDFLILSEVYTLSEFGWKKAASAKNYEFKSNDGEALAAFIEKNSIHRIEFVDGKTQVFSQKDSLLFYQAHYIPTRDNRVVALVLAGETEKTTSYLDVLTDQLLPVLSNLYHVHNIDIQFEDLSKKYKEKTAALKLNQSLLENVGDAIFYHDIKGRFIDVNQQAIISLGYSRAELLSKKVKDIDVVVNNGLPLSQILKEKVKPGQPLTIQSMHQRKDGSQFPVEVGVSLHDSGNYLAVARDISKRVQIRAELEETQSFLESVIELSESLTYVYDYKQDKIIKGASKIEEALGYPKGTIHNVSSLLDICHQSQRKAILAKLDEVKASKSNSPVEFESKMKAANGYWFWSKTSFRIFKRDEAGEPRLLIATASDISSYKELEYRLVLSQKKYKALIENSFDGVVLYDRNGDLLFSSDKAMQLLGYDSREEAPINAKGFVHPDDINIPLSTWALMLEKPGETFKLKDYRLVCKNGESIWIENTLTNLLDDPNVKGIVSNFRDISSKKKTELSLHKASNFDKVTGLPNRKFLIEQLNQQILKSLDTKGQFGVVIFDINGLNAINTSHGHVIGDEVILKVAEAIKSHISANDLLAKIGDDEFAIICSDLSTYEVSRNCQEILDKFSTLIKINEQKVKVSLSAGISIYPKDATNSRNLISNAEIALKNAKRDVEPFAFYKNYDSENTRYRLNLEKDLIEAIANNDLYMMYQPIIDCNTGKILCLESLLRWEHHEKGSIPPNLFVKIAEESNLITQLSQWVLTHVIKQISSWNQVGLYPQVTVNLSPMDIRRKNLNQFIVKQLEQHNVTPQSLILEITESEELLDLDFVISQMEDLNQTGVGIILDDFGTGFSSISHLTNLPIKAAKIDKSFIKEIAKEDCQAHNFLCGIVNLIQGSGVKTIVEGIETKEQYQILSKLDSLYGQGYLFSRPVGVNEITELLNIGLVNCNEFN